MIETLIFDVGEVLHTYNPLPMKEDIKTTLAISQQQFDECWNPLTIELELGHISEVEYWDLFKKQTGSNAILPSESLLVRGYRQGFQANAETLDIANRLDQMGFKLAILSNAIPPHASFNEAAGLLKHFPNIFYSFNIGLRKPDFRIFNYVVDKLNLEPSRGAFIDDRISNVESARSIGLNGLVFSTATMLTEDLNRLGIKL